MKYEHLSPRSQVVAGQGVAERVEYLIELPYFPVKPLDQVETWLRDAISTHVDRPLKPITFLLAPNGMGASWMIDRVAEAFPAYLQQDQRISCHPAVVAHIPSNGSMREIGAEVCQFVGAPKHHIGGPGPHATGWLNLLGQIGTRMLLLKDMQSLSSLP